MKKYQIILLVLVLAFSALGFKCDKKKPGFNEIPKIRREALSKQLATATISSQTPKGALIQSVTPLLPEQIRAIEASFDLGEAQVVAHNLTPTINRGEYKVYVVASERDYNDAGEYLPSFAVPILCTTEFNGAFNDPYCGSEYDKGALKLNGAVFREYIHYVLAAERVITEGDEAWRAWMVADNRKKFVDFMFATNFGFEHCILRKHNYGLFQSTVTHISSGHPILEVPQGIVQRIIDEHQLTNTVPQMQPSRMSRSHPFYNRPECAVPPQGDTRLMCVVE